MESNTMNISTSISTTDAIVATYAAFGDRFVLGLTASRGGVLCGTGLSVAGPFAGGGRSVAAASQDQVISWIGMPTTRERNAADLGRTATGSAAAKAHVAFEITVPGPLAWSPPLC